MHFQTDLLTSRSEPSRRFYMLTKQTRVEKWRLQREALCKTIYSSVIYQQATPKYTIEDLFHIFTKNFALVQKMKNNNYVVRLIGRQGAYNFKINQFLEIYGCNFSNLTSETLIKIYIYNWLDHQLVADAKKFKFDNGFINALVEINTKLNEVYMSLQDEKLQQLSDRIIAQKQKSNDKERYVKTIYRFNKRNEIQLQKSLQLMNSELNYRVMGCDLIDRLEKEEEKIGRFDKISTITRRTMHSLDQAVRLVQNKVLQ